MNEIQSGLTLKQAKELADRAIQDVKNGIVVAGYALRAIRNEKLWKEHGYANFDVFMEICYQKDKSWASNCIRVYEQFGELSGPEQTPKLKERYQEYSAGGLIEMLSMPEELREQVTANMPVREIRELKREAKKVVTSQPEEEQLPGQMDITDFLDEPEEQEPEKITFLPEVKSSGSFVLSTEDLTEGDLNEEQAAGRQQEILCKPTAKTLLGEYKGEWEALQAAFQDTPEEEQPPVVENTRIILQALQLLAGQERQEEAEPEEQPELPPMKNNDQRKEWLRNYQAWGLWYEDDRIGVRYYRYEFDNGAQLIAEEYPAAGKRDFTASYLHLVGGPEPPKHSSYGCPKWNRHERYTKYPDSETELVEFLKAVQK